LLLREEKKDRLIWKHKNAKGEKERQNETKKTRKEGRRKQNVAKD
jgi:hypothetical protein